MRCLLGIRGTRVPKAYCAIPGASDESVCGVPSVLRDSVVADTRRTQIPRIIRARDSVRVLAKMSYLLCVELQPIANVNLVVVT